MECVSDGDLKVTVTNNDYVETETIVNSGTFVAGVDTADSLKATTSIENKAGASFTNGGWLNSPDATFTNSGTLTNTHDMFVGKLVNNSTGIFNNNCTTGWFAEAGILENKGIINNDSNSTLWIDNGFKNTGIINNDYQLVFGNEGVIADMPNNGVINGNGTTFIYAQMINDGTITQKNLNKYVK